MQQLLKWQNKKTLFPELFSNAEHSFINKQYFINRSLIIHWSCPLVYLHNWEFPFSTDLQWRIAKPSDFIFLNSCRQDHLKISTFPIQHLGRSGICHNVCANAASIHCRKSAPLHLWHEMQSSLMLRQWGWWMQRRSSLWWPRQFTALQCFLQQSFVRLLLTGFFLQAAAASRLLHWFTEKSLCQ